MRDLAETRHEISRAQNPVETVTKLRCPRWAGSSREWYWQGWLGCQFHGNMSYLSQASFALPITHAIYKTLRFQLYRDLTAHWGSSVSNIVHYRIPHWWWILLFRVCDISYLQLNLVSEKKRRYQTTQQLDLRKFRLSLLHPYVSWESSVTNDICGGLREDIGFNNLFLSVKLSMTTPNQSSGLEIPYPACYGANCCLLSSQGFMAVLP